MIFDCLRKSVLFGFSFELNIFLKYIEYNARVIRSFFIVRRNTKRKFLNHFDLLLID